MKAILKYWNRMQKISVRDIGNIGSRNIHAHYYKLPDKSKNNKKETMKPNALYIVLDPAKFSCKSF